MTTAGHLDVGPYRLGLRLGTGGMAEVYLAIRQTPEPSEPVALKLLLPHLGHEPATVTMFINEARLAAQMTHPNIVQVLDVGMDRERYYLAMELVRGVSLSTLIGATKATGAQLPADVLLYVAHALCEGLHHAHQRAAPSGEPLNLVHRDVSPQNVLVSVDGAVKLTDFGIARTRDSVRNTSPGCIRGKFEYMAPEQVSSGEMDRRSDIFSAGVTLFHLATCHSPFRKQDAISSLKAVLVDPLPELSTLRDDLPAPFVAALTRATRKEPSERFETARELCDALPPLADGCQERLGNLVRELCHNVVERLEQKTQETRLLGGWTQPETSALATSTQPISRALGRRPWWPSRLEPRSLWLGGAALLACTTLCALALLGRQAPLASREPAVSSPAPDVLSSQPQPATVPPPAPAVPVEAPGAPPKVAWVSTRPLRPAAGAPEPPEGSETTSGTRPKPADARRPRGTGFLTVDAVPWAEVYVGGKKVGETPLASMPVPAGEVRVLLRYPVTGKEVRRTVTVTNARETFLKEQLR